VCTTFFPVACWSGMCHSLIVIVLTLLRWVCTSGLPNDLAVTDNIALQVLEGIVAKGGVYPLACMKQLRVKISS